MSQPQPTIDLDIQGVLRFHGHSCPGLSIGIRAAEVALREIGAHSVDEEIVCITEADNCAVDAIQYFIGCTFGKGNLIHRDYGKNVFTFLRRSDGKAVRVATRARFSQQTPQDREARTEAILSAPLGELFDIRAVAVEMPEAAQILGSVVCAQCGEKAMASRIRTFRGEPYCLPCFEALSR